MPDISEELIAEITVDNAPILKHLLKVLEEMEDQNQILTAVEKQQ